MNLTDLVPPIELCKLIPEGEFSGSVLCWIDFRGVYPEYSYGDPVVVVRETSWAATAKKGVYPAPTLQEILKELDEFEVWGNNISDEHTVVSEFVQYEDENTATAALKLWLKLKGIEA